VNLLLDAFKVLFTVQRVLLTTGSLKQLVVVLSSLLLVARGGMVVVGVCVRSEGVCE